MAVRRRFRKGEVVFHEGDPGDSLHLLAKGRVAVRVSTPLGHGATIAVLGEGESFGEQALLVEDSRRTATIQALESVETLQLQRADFEDLRRRHPSIERLLVDLLGAQVRRLTQQLIEALYLPADRRVVRCLARFALLYDEGACPIAVPLTQEELASAAGSTRPTANRALQPLVEQAVISLGRGRIEVHDPAALAAAASRS